MDYHLDLDLPNWVIVQSHQLARQRFYHRLPVLKGRAKSDLVAPRAFARRG